MIIYFSDMGRSVPICDPLYSIVGPKYIFKNWDPFPSNLDLSSNIIFFIFYKTEFFFKIIMSNLKNVFGNIYCKMFHLPRDLHRYRLNLNQKDI